MQLKFGNDRLDFGKLPNLTTQGIAIDALEFFATAPAFGRYTAHDLLAFLRRQQRALVFAVAGLPARFAA